jgi:hypothetical protein
MVGGGPANPKGQIEPLPAAAFRTPAEVARDDGGVAPVDEPVGFYLEVIEGLGVDREDVVAHSLGTVMRASERKQIGLG